MPIRPDVPAAARLMEAARSLRMEAAALRRAFPPRRASGAGAEVDVDADGALLALRVVDVRLLPADQWAAHLTTLYRTATGGPAVEGVSVLDLDPELVGTTAVGLGPRRFSFPAGIDDDAPPEVVLAQAHHRLRTRFAAAESASARVARLDGIGRSADEDVFVRIGSLGQLLELRTSSHLGRQDEETVNTSLAAALHAARDDLRRQVDEQLDAEGL